MNTDTLKRRTTDRASRRALRTRERLMKAALAVFSEYGVDATTIEEITERADVGKGTFYRHFRSKEAVMVALIEDALDQLIERLAVPVASAAKIEDVLENVIRAHAEFFTDNTEAFLLLFQGRLLLKLQRAAAETLEEPYMHYLRAIEAQVAPFLTQPLDHAKIRRLACAVAGFVSGFLSFAMIGMRPEEIETSMGPLRRAFVAASSSFLGSDSLPAEEGRGMES